MDRAIDTDMSGQILRVLISSPHAGLASELRARFLEEVGFEVVSTLESYPGAEQLKLALVHFRPDCLYMQCDNLPATELLLAELRELEFDGPVVACAWRHQPEPVVALLRQGAFDYIHAPLDPTVFREVAERVAVHCRRSRQSAPVAGARVVAFTSSKPGSGASTLAMQTAFALRRLTGERVLSIDLNVLSGTSAGYTKGMVEPYDVLDAAAGLPAASRCFCEAMRFNGIALLPAPAVPEGDGLAEDRARALVEGARRSFDWVVLDLPCAASSQALAVADLTDTLMLVSTPELASLNTLRRANLLLQEAGAAPESIRVVLNRTGHPTELTRAAIEEALRLTVSWSLPNDYFSLHAAGQLGLTGESPLALAVRRMAAGLAGRDEPAGEQNDDAALQFAAVV